MAFDGRWLAMTEDEISPPVTLVLGGARSGKSYFAEGLAGGQGAELVYIATAQSTPSTQAEDGEMAARIAEHRARRGPSWRTAEAPLDLPAVLQRESNPKSVVLVDCLTLWLSNLMAAEQDVPVATAALVEVLGQARGPVIVVSNEVGLGIVPMNGLARAFRDHQGRLNQQVAAMADRVIFMAAGLPLTLKGGPS